ncbi:MAG: MBL fold metallo-hydrolase [Chloroflexi bacterium]|nr:MBL fold metallo-hydrolase [Chloroflexota bacterium]
MATVQRIALGYNNVYAVEAPEGMLLVDTGPDYRGAAEAIESAIGGRTPAIVAATHGHLDHAGLAHHWQAKGSIVALGRGDEHLASHPAFSLPGEFEQFATYVEECGAPPEVCAEALHGLEMRREWATRAAARGPHPPPGRDGRWPTGLHYQPFVPDVLAGETGLPLPGGVRALLMPGHTPGNLVLANQTEGWLFSGDTLLPDITPTPAIQASGAVGGDWRFHSLPAFAGSLRRVLDLAVSHCFPGHGEPFDNVHEVVRTNLAQIEERTERVLAELKAAGAETVYGICERIYPRAVRRRFWQIVATVQGHLDLLEADGRARKVAGRYETV